MKILQILWLIFSVLILIIVIACWLILESYTMFVETYPQTYVISFLFGMGVTYPSWRMTATRKISVGILIIYTIGLFSINLTPFLHNGPEQPFQWFYKSIHPFANLTTVKQSLDRHFPANSSFPKPVCRESQQEEEIIFSCQLDPNHPYRDAEIISVYFKHDRVVRKEYSGD